MEFYQSVLGGELTVNRYDSIPGLMGDEDEGSKVLHSQLETPDGLSLMAADFPASMRELPDASVGGHSVCVWGDNLERGREIWNRLAQDATVLEDFTTAPWGDTFGMLKDRFGVSWQLSVSAQPRE